MERGRISGSQGDYHIAVLESSGAPGTRQRLTSDLVCAARAVLAETLTLVLSWRRERRAFGPELAPVDSSRHRQVPGEQLYSAARSG